MVYDICGSWQVELEEEVCGCGGKMRYLGDGVSQCKSCCSRCLDHCEDLWHVKRRLSLQIGLTSLGGGAPLNSSTSLYATTSCDIGISNWINSSRFFKQLLPRAKSGFATIWELLMEWDLYALVIRLLHMGVERKNIKIMVCLSCVMLLFC